jgi:hypothetical protein
MSYGFGPANSQMAFLQQEFFLPEGEEDVKVAISDRENRTASALNVREIGQYELVEVLNGQTWFSNRQQLTGQSQKARYGYRTTFNLVALLESAIPIGVTTIRVSPAISSIVIPTRCFGAATIAGPKYVFFPSMLVDVVFDNSNPAKQTLTITNNTAGVFSQCYVTVEYLKQP